MLTKDVFLGRKIRKPEDTVEDVQDLLKFMYNNIYNTISIHTTPIITFTVISKA